jgi:hypothetical protein
MFRRSTLLSMLSAILLAVSVASFSIAPQFATSTIKISATARYMNSKDKNGKELTVGSVVQISVPDLKAFQVQSKGFGHFEDGTFVPLVVDNTTPRAFKNLVLPVGMRGIVTKVYDPDGAVSVNLPVQVKFVPGAYPGLNPPVPFLMHFETNEIETVV